MAEQLTLHSVTTELVERLSIEPEWTVSDESGWWWLASTLAQHAELIHTPHPAVRARTPLVTGVRPGVQVDLVCNRLTAQLGHSAALYVPSTKAVELHAQLPLMGDQRELHLRWFARLMALNCAAAHALANDVATELGGRPAAVAHPVLGRRLSPHPILLTEQSSPVTRLRLQAEEDQTLGPMTAQALNLLPRPVATPGWFSWNADAKAVELATFIPDQADASEPDPRRLGGVSMTVRWAQRMLEAIRD